MRQLVGELELAVGVLVAFALRILQVGDTDLEMPVRLVLCVRGVRGARARSQQAQRGSKGDRERTRAHPTTHELQYYATRSHAESLISKTSWRAERRRCSDVAPAS